MENTKSTQAAGLRKLAELLATLADDLEAGHAIYVRGNLDFTAEPASGLERMGEAPIGGKMPHGEVAITADILFLTGQPNA